MKMTLLSIYKIPRNQPKNPPPGTKKGVQQSHRIQTLQAQKLDARISCISIILAMNMWIPQVKIQWHL